MRHDEAVITVAAAPVHAYRAGTGPTLVLLHGAGLDDAQLSWAPVWPALTGYARLIAPDLPGYGGSPLGHTEPTLEGYRTWLLAFLDVVGIHRAVLVGLSLGGGIALRTAVDAPTRVAGLVLLAPYGVERRSGLAGQLGAIGCPVLLLSGARDGLVPPDDVRAAAAHIRHARFVLVEGAGHWLPRDALGRSQTSCLDSWPPRLRPRQHPRTALDRVAASVCLPTRPVIPRIPARPPAATLPASDHASTRGRSAPWTPTRSTSTPRTKS
jgi:pimeloyl-ACP methyl ester carboxylesterase